MFERFGVGAFGGVRVVVAAAGWHHSSAVTEDGALWTWGGGDNGELGHGDEEDDLEPTVVLGAGLGGGRIGRCRGRAAEHALAFAMGTHGRLGVDGQAAGAGVSESSLLEQACRACSHTDSHCAVAF